jgi:hypothetical protein
MDPHLPGTEGFPYGLAGFRIERLDPAADAHLPPEFPTMTLPFTTSGAIKMHASGSFSSSAPLKEE